MHTLQQKEIPPLQQQIGAGASLDASASVTRQETLATIVQFFDDRDVSGELTSSDTDSRNFLKQSALPQQHQQQMQIMEMEHEEMLQREYLKEWQQSENSREGTASESSVPSLGEAGLGDVRETAAYRAIARSQ